MPEHNPSQSLADAQHRLLLSLTGKAPCPPDFSAVQINRTAAMLLAKRAKNVVLAAPALAAALEPHFYSAFHAYAAATPIPPGGAKKDAIEFAKHLSHDDALPVDASRAILAVLISTGAPLRMDRLGNRYYVTVRLPRNRYGTFPLLRASRASENAVERTLYPLGREGAMQRAKW